MRKSIVMLVLFIFAFVSSGITQQMAKRERSEIERTERSGNKSRYGKGDCRKMEKRHMRKMRKMAAIDGRVTPSEKILLRRERRKLY